MRNLARRLTNILADRQRYKREREREKGQKKKKKHFSRESKLGPKLGLWRRRL